MTEGSLASDLARVTVGVAEWKINVPIDLGYSVSKVQERPRPPRSSPPRHSPVSMLVHD
jgi:hypothetical protein